jgi:hypothetical protein
MLNQAMLTQKDVFNEFTLALVNYYKLNGTATVKLRNDTYIDVKYEGAEDLDETEIPGFRSIDYKYSWHRDGSSYKNTELDIVECYHLQSENLFAKLGISINLIADDERCPTLVLSSDNFDTVGYSLNVNTGTLSRICLCDAREASECVCGYWDDELL